MARNICITTALGHALAPQWCPFIQQGNKEDSPPETDPGSTSFVSISEGTESRLGDRPPLHVIQNAAIGTVEGKSKWYHLQVFQAAFT